ncbi:MAG: 50S ribosomal protein L3 [Patescibacteria group bacterium]
MRFILGKKIGMTQVFSEDGNVVPVTLVQAGPCIVTAIRVSDKDKYQAVQIGFDSKKKVNKPQKGQLKDLGNFKYLKEFRTDNLENYKIGDKIGISIFKKGESVDVSSVSIGKGFQGVVKRHHFRGHPATHGHKDQSRMSGSIGATGPQRVLKGTRMAGRMGGERVTVKNLEIVDIDTEKNFLFINGAIAGGENALLEIRTKN